MHECLPDDGIFGIPVSTTAEKVLEMFRRTGAYLEGHFRLTSGLHSPEYLQCALVLQHPRYAEMLGLKLAEELRKIEPVSKLRSEISDNSLLIDHEPSDLRNVHIRQRDGRRAVLSLDPLGRQLIGPSRGQVDDPLSFVRSEMAELLGQSVRDRLPWRHFHAFVKLDSLQQQLLFTIGRNPGASGSCVGSG